MRIIFCHVEEPSMEAMLNSLLPRLLKDRATFTIINHGSKDRLLKDMPQRLTGYQSMSRNLDIGVLALVDRDDEKCRTLKNKLEKMSTDKGIATKSSPDHDGLFLVVNRVVVEELESWFFGDLEAVHQAYPRISTTLAKKRAYRDPDAIRGGTWEALHREMKKLGYVKDHFPKIDIARNIAPGMVPEQNRSASFQAFMSGLEALLALPSLGKTNA